MPGSGIAFAPAALGPARHLLNSQACFNLVLSFPQAATPPISAWM